MNQNENPTHINFPMSKDSLISKNQARAFGKELNNIYRNNSFENKDEKMNNAKQNEAIVYRLLANDSQRVNTQISQAKTEEAKDGQLTSEKFVAKFIGDDDDLNLDQVDLAEINNPRSVAIYAKEIFDNLLREEQKYAPNPQYMYQVQYDVNEMMRGILIDWIVDVHLKFKLAPETLYLTVNLIDRYLSHTPIVRQQLQLVGVGSIFIACKYEEDCPKEIKVKAKDLVHITAQAYTRDEILEMEDKMLKCFNFSLTVPSSYRFLERFARVCCFDEESLNMARYLLELALIEYKMIKYLPSNLACSAILLVNKLFKRDGWPDFMIYHTKYDETQLRAAGRDFCLLLHNAGKGNLQAVKRKFASPQFLKVSKIKWD